MDGSNHANRQNPLMCWSCKGPVKSDVLFCETCGAVQPPGQTDHFTRLGIEPVYDLDVDQVERDYFELQRQLHPDRFANKSATEKNLSQQQSTSLNDAFETLKDPLRRADYLLVHLGHEGISHDHTVNDPVLLMEAMETREALAATQTVEDVNVMIDKARRDVKECINKISAAFAQSDLKLAHAGALRLKYLTKLLEETRHHKSKLVMG